MDGMELAVGQLYERTKRSGLTMKSFDALYRTYANDVYRYALYLCGHTEWAEEITSETFVRALTKRDTLRMPTVKSYLLAIARNLYLKEVKAATRYEVLSDALPDHALSPEARTEQRLELGRLGRFVQALPEVDRSVFLMRLLYDMPYKEIASTLGISPAAARVKVHRTRLAYIETIEDEDEEKSYD